LQKGHNEIMTSERLEAFSDGVIAIIITITILIIDLPDGNDMAALVRVLPLVLCYLISFIMVGANWANHQPAGLGPVIHLSARYAQKLALPPDGEVISGSGSG
jgi:hypothetical protein